ncbi:MAG: hypothetical protein WBB45_03575 [Cyclobacteriaceae bacterium]
MEKQRIIPGHKYNRYAYGAFLVLSIIFILSKDLTMAGSCVALSLVFDPFDPAVPFSKRPGYQKAILLIQLVTAIALIGLGLFNLI